MTVRAFEWPEPCAGDHELFPHAHAEPGRDYHAGCSGRYWCARCWRWSDGEACEPGRIVPALLVAA